MAVNVNNTNYAGEALQQMLVTASTGNELVSRGLIKVVPDIATTYSLPRIKTGKMLRKKVEQPDDSHSQGNFDYSERKLEPKEFMAFTTFNPRAFEKVWRPFQPTGELVFRSLPPHIQAQLLSELAKTVDFELGGHVINGEYADGDDMKLFDGILTKIVADDDVIALADAVALTQDNIIAKMTAVHKRIPKAIRNHPNLRIMMSTTDWDKYDDALTARDSKGANYTSTNEKKFKNIKIEDLSDWPENVIVVTVTGTGMDTNLWMGVSSSSDYEAVKVDRLTNAGERYFFKMLMKADTEIAFGEQCVLYDGRA
jgi:hypothetical protein